MNTFVKIGENFASFWNLLVLSKNNLFNSAVYKKQNRKLRKLMKRAYEIPFYRKKFDTAGLKPKDIKNVIGNLKAALNNILRETNCNKYELYLGGSDNFRVDLPLPFRPTKPILLPEFSLKFSSLKSSFGP